MDETHCSVSPSHLLKLHNTGWPTIATKQTPRFCQYSQKILYLDKRLSNQVLDLFFEMLAALSCAWMLSQSKLTHSRQTGIKVPFSRLWCGRYLTACQSIVFSWLHWGWMVWFLKVEVIKGFTFITVNNLQQWNWVKQAVKKRSLPQYVKQLRLVWAEVSYDFSKWLKTLKKWFCHHCDHPQ